MAFLKLEAEIRTREFIFTLKEEFPNVEARMLAMIGSRSREILKRKYLSGQDLMFTEPYVDKIGRRTLRSDVSRRKHLVKVYAYPLNLFERGRKLRDGSKQKGTFTISKKLTRDVKARLPQYIAEAEKRILQPALNKVGIKL